MPFDNMIFHQPFGLIEKERISSCTELKLQATMERKALGSFCETFSVWKIQAHSIEKAWKSTNGKGKTL